MEGEPSSWVAGGASWGSREVRREASMEVVAFGGGRPRRRGHACMAPIRCCRTGEADRPRLPSHVGRRRESGYILPAASRLLRVNCPKLGGLMLNERNGS